MYAVKKKKPAPKLKVVENEVEILNVMEQSSAADGANIAPRFPDDDGGDADEAEGLGVGDRVDVMIEASKLARARMDADEEGTDPFAIADAMVAWCLKDD